MAEYITKEQALQAVRDAVDAKEEAIHAIGVYIDALNVTDVAPVVYCKDCKWIGPGNCCVGGLYSYQHGGCNLLKIGISDIETFYCAEGCKR